jgi:hypothetical protein
MGISSNSRHDRRRVGRKLAALCVALAALLAPVTGARDALAASGRSAHSSRGDVQAGPLTPTLPATGAWFGAHPQIRAGQADSKEALLSFEALAGRKMAIYRDYFSWDAPFPDEFSYWLRDNGYVLLASWYATLSDGGGSVSWRDIANGLYDGTIDARADDIKAFGAPLFLIFNHEPENDVLSGTAEDFVAAWQHVHDRFVADGVTNVSYVLTLMAFTYRLGTPDAWYPGDDYVDVVGADGYNWYSCPGRGDPWTTFYNVFSGFHDYGVLHGKPEMIAEWSSMEDPDNPGAKGQWITDAAATLKTWPEVKAVSWYDAGPPTHDCTWWIDTSQPSLDAFKAMGADPYFNPPPPLTTITSGPATLTNSTTATFNFSANVAATFTCSLDGEAPSDCSTGKTYDNLAEGARVFTVTATDANDFSGPATYNWTVDSVPPVVTIESSPAPNSHDPDPSFNIDSSDPSSGGFTCSLDTVPTDPCGTWVDYTGVPDGVHTFTANAFDDAGNFSAPQSYTWTIDTIPPAVSIVGPPAIYGSKSASFTLSSNESGATYKCSLDGGSFNDCTSPKTYWVTEGAHSFLAEAIDLAGNTGTPASWAWSVDTTKPAVAFTSTPANPTSSTTASFSFTVTDVNPTTSTCQLDTGPAIPCGPGVSAGYASDTFTRNSTDSWGSTKEGSAWAYPTGQNADFDVNGSAGTTNIGVVNSPRLAYLPQLWTDSEVLVRFQVDKMPSINRVNVYVVGRYDPASTGPFYTVRAGYLPSGTMMIAATKKPSGGVEAQVGSELSLGSIAAANTWFWVRAKFANEGSSVRIQGKVWKDGTPEPAAYQLSYLDSSSPIMTAGRDGLRASPSATNTPFLVSWDDLTAAAGTTYANLANAVHSFTVASTDSAGNVGTGVYTWTVDTVPPAATIISGPTGTINLTSATFKFASNETGGTFTCKLDAGVATACNSPIVYSNLGDGTHTFTVTAIDKAGNASAPLSQSWTVDTVAPTAHILTGPTSLTNVKSVSFTFSSNESPSAFKCSLDGSAFTACTSPKTYWVAVDGAHSFKVQAIDVAGNVGAPVTWSWTLDATRPTVTITSGPSNPSTQTTATFTFTASESNVTFTCTLDIGLPAACTSGITYSGIVNGAHSFKVYGTDLAGNVGSIITYGWQKI